MLTCWRSAESNQTTHGGGNFVPRFFFLTENIVSATIRVTDGNNHGIYFGAKYLKKKTGIKPVMYVSDSAHYSSRRHIDGSLFGAYLPYTEYKDIVNRNVTLFDSIAVSGHNFFGMDEPAGFFITTKEVRDNQTRYDVPYLNCSMPMINCSRSAVNSHTL